MADKFEVDVPGLIQGAVNVAHRTEVLAVAHGRSVASIGNAQAGWVGSSAHALAAMAGKWEQISARHGKAIESHASNMDTAAKLFADMEERHAQKLNAVGEQARSINL